MKTRVVTKSKRVKSARGRARRGSTNEISLEAACAFLKQRLERRLHSLDDGAAVQSLSHLIERTEQENRAWRETAARESQNPHPEGFAAFRCHDCDARFLADRVFDVARKAELALLAAGIRAELTPCDEMMAEALEAPRKWERCPECASANIGEMWEACDVEAHSIVTVTEVAGELMDDIRSELSDFEESAEARTRCMRTLWELCASLSRGCELARESEKYSEMVRDSAVTKGTRLTGERQDEVNE
jgi:hypothetical protein